MAKVDVLSCLHLGAPSYEIHDKPFHHQIGRFHLQLEGVKDTTYLFAKVNTLKNSGNIPVLVYPDTKGHVHRAEVINVVDLGILPGKSAISIEIDVNLPTLNDPLKKIEFFRNRGPRRRR